MTHQPPGCPEGMRVKQIYLSYGHYGAELEPIPAGEISDTERVEHIARYGLPKASSWSNFREWIDEDIRYIRAIEDAKAARR